MVVDWGETNGFDCFGAPCLVLQRAKRVNRKLGGSIYWNFFSVVEEAKNADELPAVRRSIILAFVDWK